MNATAKFLVNNHSFAIHLNQVRMVRDLLNVANTGYYERRTGTIVIGKHEADMSRYGGPVRRYFVSKTYQPNLRISTDNNWFFTPNSFGFHFKPHFSWKRKHCNARHVCGLNAFVLDCDTYKNGIKTADFLVDLPMILGQLKLPDPTYVVYSGHGLHLLWFFDRQVQVNDWKRLPAGPHHTKWHSKIMAIWRETAEALVKRFNQACAYFDAPQVADPQCTNPNRILRLPGSFNHKPDDYDISRRCFVLNRRNTHVNMFKLYRRLVDPEYRKMHAKRALRAKQAHLAYLRQRRIAHPHPERKGVSQFAVPTGWYARLADLKKLVFLRDTRGYLTGYRHSLLAVVADEYEQCYRHQGRLAKDQIPQAVAKRVWDFNDRFDVPINVHDCQAFINELAGGCIAGYTHYYHTAKIIRYLRITPDEQQHLHVLIGDQSQNIKADMKRHNERRRRKRNYAQRRANRDDAVNYARTALKCTYRQIARRIHISISTVTRILHNFRTNQSPANIANFA